MTRTSAFSEASLAVRTEITGRVAELADAQDLKGVENSPANRAENQYFA
jgi:hypothetical protein